MLSKLTKYLPKHRSPKSSQLSTVQLGIESLEERVVPVVGAFQNATAVMPGTGYDGVVRVNGASGTLLSSGRHILTAAHVLTDGNGTIDRPSTNITFDMPGKSISHTVSSSSYSIHPNWNGDVEDGFDLAVIELPEVAPGGAERHGVFRGNDEVGRWFYIVGYGATGNGSNGASSPGTKRIASNFYDHAQGPGNSILKSDFDSNQNQWPNSGFVFEGMAAPGDSGGPSFLWGPTGLEVAGVTSYAYESGWGWGSPEFEFGERFYSTRVSSFSGWIDQQVGGSYDLVLDMTRQVAGNDGASDYIHVYDTNGTLTLYINGSLVHSDAVGNIQSITIRGSNDNDYVSFHVTGHLPATMPINIDGRLGSDSMNVYTSSANDSVVLENGRVRANGVRVNYVDMANVYVNTGYGNDIVSVYSTSSSTPVSISTSSGDDYIYVGSNLANMGGDIWISGGSGQDRLVVSDTAYSWGSNYTINGNQVSTQRMPWLSVSHSSIENMVLTTGSGNDTIHLHNTSSYVTTTVRAGSGNDTLNGDHRNNILLGEYGNDTINGGGGRDLLIGGIGADLINGGAGEDILIDGITSYDYNYTALTAVIKEWARTDQTYSQRSNHIRNGGGMNGNYKLNSSTVTSDYNTDTLNGGDDYDWFWATHPFVPGIKPRDVLPDWMWLVPFGTPEKLN